jgi:hypothetical protein
VDTKGRKVGINVKGNLTFCQFYENIARLT